MNTKKSRTSKTKTITKTKTLPTTFEDFEKPKPPKCPKCSSEKHIIKAGIRKVKDEMVQDYLCKDCNKKFVDRTLKQSFYPTHLILRSLTYFNLGHILTTNFNGNHNLQRNFQSRVGGSDSLSLSN